MRHILTALFLIPIIVLGQDPQSLAVAAVGANAGHNQTAKLRDLVVLDGSGSTNPSGIGTLSYSWKFASRPVGSGAVLLYDTTVEPGFVVDVPGDYVINLTVTNGVSSGTASVTVTTINTAPVADAGRNQSVAVGSQVFLEGHHSSDVDGDVLSYQWSLASQPVGSQAQLKGADTASPVFVADKAGEYVALLSVSDGMAKSNPATVTITTKNTAPVANAGASQVVQVPSVVQLNGAGSTDVDGDLLSYQWSLINVPAGSQATLSSATAVNPTFNADVLGTYVAQLMVQDGHASSAPATVTISTGANQAPTAHAGPNQSVRQGTLAMLAGSGTDPQNLTLTYRWSLISVPAGSHAALSSSTIANPSFFTDVDGTYVAQLMVNNGVVSSAPSTVTISTNGNTPPVANAGANQSVLVGAAVALDGSGSSDADQHALSYAWSLLSLPEGSGASLAGAQSATPAFTADVTGTYVAQLIVNDGISSSDPATVTITTQAAAFGPAQHSSLSSAAGKGTGQTQTLNIGGPVSALVPSKVGIFRPASFMMVAQDVNGNIAWDQDIDRAAFFGTTGDTIIYGDWDGSGTTKVGIFRSSVGMFALDMNGNGAWDPGIDTYGFFGQAGDVPIVGDWNGDGRSKIGIYRPQTTLFTVDYNGNLAFDAGTDKSGKFGVVGDTPIIGDWTGDGKAKIGVFRNGLWILDSNNTMKSDAGDTQGTIGQAGDVPLLGDWNGDGRTKVGIYRASAAMFSEDYNGNLAWDNGVDRAGVFGPAGSTPVVGDWDGTGVTRVGVFYGNGYWGLDINGNLVWDAGVQWGGFGAPTGDTPVVGRWAAPPASITATSGTPQTAAINTAFASPLAATVKDAGNHPVSGVVVTFTAPSSGASGSFAGGVNTATTNALGVATSVVFTANGITGSYTVSASAPGGVASPVAFALTNTPPPFITLTGTSIGQNLQTTINFSLSQPAPGSGVDVTLTSADPSKVLLAGRPGDAGTTSLVVNVPGNQSTIGGIFVQGLVSSGTVMVTATAANYTNGTATMTLTPSGFTLAGPSGVSTAFSANQGSNTTLTVSAVQLDAGFHILQGQQIRGGLSVSVPVTSSATSVGTITTSPVIFNGGDNSVSTQFHAVSPGSTTLAAAAPLGFSVLSQGNSVSATVSPMALNAGSVTVGKNLETTTQVTLTGTSPAGGITITLTSNNPSQMLLAAVATDPGSASITVKVKEGFTVSPAFFIQGLADSGTATYTASEPVFGNSTGTVTLAPSGFVIAGPTGLGQASFSTTTGSGNSTITVYSALLNSSLNYVSQMPVTATVNVPVISSNTAAGVITTSPVVIAAGTLSATTQFQPVAQGSTTLSGTQPAGFATPAQNGSVSATVITPGMAISDGIAVGFNLETIGTVTLGAPAPPTGLDVTLTSNSAPLLLSNTGGAGSGVITVHIAAGGTNGTYYMQSTASSGTATYTATAPGFASRTGNITLTPSGAVIAGSFGLNTPFFVASVSGGTAPVTVYMAQLDPATNHVASIQALTAGQSVSVSLTSSATAFGTIASPVIINGGPLTVNGVVTQFTPISPGNTNVSVVPLSGGYAAATDNITLTALVGQ